MNRHFIAYLNLPHPFPFPKFAAQKKSSAKVADNNHDDQRSKK